jgi:SagB-type dehydrogenase family enzyme
MIPNSGIEFIEKTKYAHLGQSNQQRTAQQPPLEIPWGDDSDIHGLTAIDVIETPIKSIIEQRSSVRIYKESVLTLPELSYLLWCTQGVKEIRNNQSTLRTVPSAGARHALETFLLINAVKGLKPGLYRFLALQHKLKEYKIDATFSEKITKACLDQSMVKQSAVTFIWVAIVDRMFWRYQERGYRYLFLDAGHVCQNLYLAGESINCGVCALAAFDDNKMNELLNRDGKNEFVIYMATLGKK